MKTLVLYSSKYGCVEDCIKYLKNQINNETEIASLKSLGKINLQPYDWIVIGGSVYVGKIQKEVKLFCEENLQMLLTKNIALFICCTTPEQVGEYFKNNFPAQLLSRAIEAVDFGGELRQDRMGFFDRKITALISKLEPKTTGILYKNIDQLAISMSGK